MLLSGKGMNFLLTRVNDADLPSLEISQDLKSRSRFRTHCMVEIYICGPDHRILVYNKARRNGQGPAFIPVICGKIDFKFFPVNPPYAFGQRNSNPKGDRDHVTPVTEHLKRQSSLFYKFLRIGLKLGRYRNQRSSCCLNVRIAFPQGYQLCIAVGSPISPIKEDHQRSFS